MQPRELHGLTHDSIIALYTLDLTPIGVTGEGSILRFCNEPQILGQDVRFNNLAYPSLPIQCTGFELSGQGQLPTPQLQVSNVLGIFTPILLQYQDILGAKFTRIRTFAKHLDTGSDPNINAVSLPDIYYVERKVSEDAIQVTFELKSVLDLQGVKIPGRVCYANYCGWDYRSSECGYTGTNYFNEFNQPVANANQDKCNLTLTACERRQNRRNFGGFPGIGQLKFQ